VYHLGYHSQETFGAAPYLVVRPEGNVMIDAPRFHARIAGQIEALGGVAYHIYTHAHTAVDNDLWKAYFPDATRVIHRLDAPRNVQLEAVLNGKGPWYLDDDITILHTPGHTPGSIGVVVKSAGESVLFSGDTVGWSPKLGRLDGFAHSNPEDMRKQAESMGRLGQEADFDWIVPAQGLKYRFPSARARVAQLAEAAEKFMDRGRVPMMLQ
jgi:glyoxylase-like metal-dependent hydrolase (beta-lactamase superfamily II)